MLPNNRFLAQKNFKKTIIQAKKSSHTLKTQLVTTARGRILSVSRPYSGKNHDFKIFKAEINKLYSKLNIKDKKKIEIYADSGY